MVLLSGPNISGNEWKYVKECLDTEWVSSVGSYVSRFEEMLAEHAGTNHAVATASGTTALHISLILSGIGAGDYVITTNITFIATLNAIKYTGADPILMDIDPGTWQMDLDLLEQFLEEECMLEDDGLVYKKNGRRVKAIMPVHVLGNMCDMGRLSVISDKWQLPVIEDAAEALGSYCRDQHAGSFGRLGCFSFNGNKIVTCGGGGMIVTDDEQLARRAKHLTTQAKADPLEYFHDSIGYNYRLTNVAAAIGVGQMENLEVFLRRKEEVRQFYQSELNGIGDISFQKVDDHIQANWWLFTIKTNSMRPLLSELNSQKLQSRPLWVPMNHLPMFRDDIYYNTNDVSSQVYDKCLSIPCSTNIKDEDLEAVVQVIKRVF